jgi:hypothetical protein
MFAALALVACGGGKKLQQDVDPIATNSTPSYSIEEIDAELATMLKSERDLNWHDYENNVSNCELKDSLQRAFEKRMEYHLCNPLTFTESLPELEEMVSVITVPSGRCKFYNYSLDSGGPMSDDKNFIQYRDANGNVRCFPYMNDLTICNGPRGICDVWEFELENKFYYAIKTYRRQAWYAWTYYLDIITIEDDKIVTCTDFFNNEHGDIIDTDEFFVYDENGKFLDEVWFPTYYIKVCGTQTGNNNVGFDFDPETLTVSVKDDADWTESRTGAVVEREWKLDTSRMGLKFDLR